MSFRGAVPMRSFIQILTNQIYRILILTLFCLSISLLPTVAYSQMEKSSPPEVKIPGTQLLHITSSIMGQEYGLYVNLPRYYDDTTRIFPVLYLLDAQWDFPLVNAVFGEQYYDGFVPEFITVGITWAGKNPNYDSLRAGDFTPTHIQQVPQSGQGAKFLSFIKKELVPFIDSAYRTKKSDRTLMGSSLGGLFTLYAMFNETKLFNRYVLTSPALGWDNEVIDTYEKAYAAKKSELPARLFMAVGEHEGGVPSFQKFVERLKARNYKELDLQTRILEGMGHSGSKAEGFGRGLQAVFSKPSVEVSPEILKQYVGTYKLGLGPLIKISMEDGQLILHSPDNSTLALHAESEKDFYAKGVFLFIHFNKNDAGQVIGFHARQFSGEMNLNRVND
jgi:predicted alpha/beta superfamily hydrolase